MPNPKYYQITLPSGSTQIWDEDKVNRNKSWLDEKNARFEEVNQFEVTLPSGSSQTWDAEKYGKNIDWLDQHQAKVSGSLVRPIGDQTEAVRMDAPVMPEIQEQPSVQVDTAAPVLDKAMMPTIEQPATAPEEEVTTNFNDEPAILGRISAAQRELEEIERQLSEKNKVYSNMPVAPGAPSTFGPRMADKDYRRLQAAAENKRQEIRQLQHLQDGTTNHFWTNIGDVFANPSTWTFGLAGMDQALVTLDAANDHERDASQVLIGSLLDRQVAESEAEEERGFWGHAGRIAGQMVPFMVEIGMTGGLGGVAEAVEGKVANLAGQYAEKKVVKALGTLAGDLASGIAMAGTIGAAHTVEGMLDRKQGQIVSDENGNLQMLDGYYKEDPDGAVIDEDGKRYTFVENPSWLSAGYKALMSQALEYSTERLGEHLQKGVASAIAKRAVAKGKKSLSPAVEAIVRNWEVNPEDFGLTAVSRDIRRGFGSRLAERSVDYLNRMGIQGYPFEGLEEEANIIFNAALVGDNKFSDLWDKEQQADIWGGMFFSAGAMQAIPFAATVGFDAVNAYKAGKAKRYTKLSTAMETAADNASAMIGERWSSLRDNIDETVNGGLPALETEIMDSDEFTPDEKQAICDYIHKLETYRGFNNVTAAQAREAIENGAETKTYAEGPERIEVDVPGQMDAAYMGGYNAADEQQNDIQKGYEFQKEQLKQLTGLDDISAEEVQPYLQNGNWSDEQKRAVLDFLMAKEAREGMIQGIRDDIQRKVVTASTTIDRNTSKTDGMIHPVTLKDSDRRAYIVDGTAVMTQDGTSVDRTKSMHDLLLRDAETGELFFASVDQILSVEEALDPVAEKQTVTEQIRQSIAQDAADRIDGILQFAAGDEYMLTTEDGVSFPVQIVPNEQGVVDNGDGTVNVIVNGATDQGKPVISQMPKDQIQAMVDATRMASIQQYADELKAARDAKKSLFSTKRNNDDEGKGPPPPGAAGSPVLAKEGAAEETVEEQPAIPVDAQGRKQYMQAPTEASYEDIYSDENFENDDEAYGFISGKVNRAEEALNQYKSSADEIKPEDYDSPAEYRAAKNQAIEAARPFQEAYDYWKGVQELADADIAAAKERVSRAEAEEEQALQQPQSLDEVAANALRDMGHTLDKEDFKRETGMSDAQLKKFFPFWAKDGKGMGVQQFAETIAANDQSGLATDTQAVRDAVVAVMRSASRPADIYDYTRNANVARRERMAQETANAAAAPVDEQVVEQAPATPTQQAIAQAEAQVNTAPTEGQKEAGNYRMGHVKVDGFDISIENPKGSVRRGVSPDGKAWETKMNNTYGYLRRTEGKDGDHIDVFLSDNPEQGNVFVVDQVDPKTGQFDEHKVMYGFNSAEEAKAAYLSNYEDGWQGLGNITEVSRDEFKKWVDSSHRKTKPFAEYKSVKPVELSPEEMYAAQKKAVLEQTQARLDDLQGRMDQATDPAEAEALLQEKIAIIREMLDALGIDNADIQTRATIIGQFRADGATLDDVQAIEDMLQYTADFNLRFRGFRGDGKVYIIADDNNSAIDALTTYLHENKHLENRASGAIDEGVATGVSRAEMFDALRKLTGTNAYDNCRERAQVDEILANAEEIAETDGIEAIPEKLKAAGISNEKFITFVQNNIRDGRQAKSEHRSPSSRDSRLDRDGQGNGRQDGRNPRQRSGEVAGPRLRSSEGSQQGTRSGEGQPDRAAETGGLTPEQKQDIIAREGVSSIEQAALVDDSGIQLSIRTEEDVERKIRDFAKSKEAKELGWTDETIENIIGETADLIRAIHAEVSGNKYYDEWAQRNPTVKVDWRDGVEKPTVTWSRANIEYKYDMSADLLCINNEGLETVLASPTMVDIMMKMNDFTKEGFTSDDYLRLYETLRDMGFVVPCKGCFDAAMRLKMLPSVSRKFVDLVNRTIDERNADPEAFDAKLRAEAGDNATIGGLPTSAKNKEDAVRIGVAGDKLTEHISWAQLMSAEGQTKALSDWGGIFRAWQRTGAGRPKDKLLPEPWSGDIVSSTTTIIGKYGEKTPSYRDINVNQGTGLRRNSHSEFRPILAIDEIQFMREAFIRGLTVFKYMKELDDVRLFGQLGVKFNMSFFPAFVEGAPAAGLDVNGDYIAAEESVGGREYEYIGEDGKLHYDGMRGWEEAQKYLNKDVSLSSVVFSIPHLIKTLTDVPTAKDPTGMWGSLIPFHASGATAASLKKQGLGQARAIGLGHGFEEAMTDYDKGVTNFEAVQNDRFGEGWKILEGKKAGTDVEPGHKLEFANGTHYYNERLGLHLFPSFYIFDSELKKKHLDKKGNVVSSKAKADGHPFTVDYNDKVREIGTDTAYKDAADFYIQTLREIGLVPRFDFEVPEETFLKMCADAKVDPNHPKLGWKGAGNSWSPVDSDAYYSLFCDYGMIDPETGKLAPHNPVGVIDENGNRVFRLPDNAIDIIRDGIERYGARKSREENRVLDAIEEFAKRTVAEGKLSQEDAESIVSQAREEATLTNLENSPSTPDEWESAGIRPSIRAKEDPKKTITVYKLVRLGENKEDMHTLFIDSANPMKAGIWYDADSPNMDFLRKMPAGIFLVDADKGTYTSLEDYQNQNQVKKKTKWPTVNDIDAATAQGLRWVKITDKETKQTRYEGEKRSYDNIGINGDGAVSTYAMRPGYHAGSLPTMRQIGLGPKDAPVKYRDENFVWVEGLMPADIDYNEEAQKNPGRDIPTHIPEDGYYMKATNANKKASQADRVGWYVAGSFKPVRFISDIEARQIIDKWNQEHPDATVEYDWPRKSGKVFNAETMELEDAPQFSVRGQEIDRFSPEVQREMDDIRKSAEKDGTFMKAPNGQDTKLSEDNWLLTRTKNFKNWFGDWEKDPENASKVVDENGEPRVVYHGTKWNPLAEKPGKAVFDVDRVGDNFDFVDIDWNFFFTASEASAKGYGRAVPVFLNLRNPEVHTIRERVSYELDEETGHDIVVTAHDAGSEYDEVTKVEKPDGAIYTIRAVDVNEAERKFGEAIKVWEGEHREELEKEYNALGEQRDDIVKQLENERHSLYEKMGFSEIFTGMSYDDLKDRVGFVLDQTIDEAAKMRKIPTEKIEDLQRQFNEVDQKMFRIFRRVGIEGRPEYEDYKGDEVEYDYKQTDMFALDNPNQIKSATNNNGEFDPNNPDIRFSITAKQDKDYLSAVKNEDIKTERKLLEQAAREAGYDSPLLYHGTDAFGFTVIDNNARGADGYSFWATNKEEVSSTYTKFGKKRSVNSEITYDDMDEYREGVSEKMDDAIADFRRLIDRTFSEWYFGQQGNGFIRKSVEEANPKSGEGDGVYDVLQDMVVDAFDEYGDEFEDYEDFADWEENSEEWRIIEDAIINIESLRGKLADIDSGDLFGGIYELYAKTDNMFVVDAKGKNWNDLHPEGLPKIVRGQYKDVPYRTRDVADWALKNGYDGVIFKNIVDSGRYGLTPPSDVYAFFKPNAQVKSANPVTYDDNGNVIPLSQRFNPASNDIRFSVKGDDIASIAQDLYDRYVNQDGEANPWMSESELITRIEEELPFGLKTKDIFSKIDEYRRLDEEDFNEGRRDFSGSEKADVFQDIITGLQKLNEGNEPRFSVKNNEEYMAAVESGDTGKAQDLVDKAAEDAGYRIRGYHGTTHNFTIFDRSKGNAEGNWGKGFYFTNNRDDAQYNYANEDGPDLTNRIEMLAENMEWMDGYEDLDYDERLEKAREMLAGDNPHVISAAIRMDNPLILDSRGGQKETYFDYDPGYNYETEEYEGEESGMLVDFINAWNDVLDSWEWEGNNIPPDGILEYADYDGLTASQLETKAREILDNSSIMNSEGEIASGEFLRQVFERMGFDGIVDNNVNQKFGTQRKYGRSMDGMDYGTAHIIAFHPEQIKQTDPFTYDDSGNVIPLSERFNRDSEDIRFSIKADPETEKLFDAAKERFGTTRDLREAGYVLPDGSLLDFSGRHLVDPKSDTSWMNGMRQVDHRDIEDLNFESDLNTPSGMKTDMSDFIRRGAIRIHMPGSINLYSKPTPQQKPWLQRLINSDRSFVRVDFGDGNHSDHYADYENANAARILFDIDGYFDDGIKPEGNAPMFSITNRTQNGFISNAEASLDKIKMVKATPEQWLKMLEKEGGLKAGEDKWLGLSDWLKSQDKKTVTKQEIADYIAEHRIQIEEVNYSESAEKTYADAIESYRTEYRQFVEEGKAAGEKNPYVYAYEQMGERYGDDFDLAFERDGDTISPSYDYYGEDLGDAAKYFLDQRRDSNVQAINSTRLGYTTEGLDNKREIALTVPTIEPWNQGDNVHFGDAGEGRAVAWIRFGDTFVSKAKDKAEKVFREAGKKYQEYKDALVAKYALRATGTKPAISFATEEEKERADELKRDMQQKRHAWQDNEYPQEKVLVIDEIQSKRHQEGREKGYQPSVDEYMAEKGLGFRENDKDYEIYWLNDGRMKASVSKTLPEAETPEKAKEYLVKTGLMGFNERPAPAPFEKNWHELAMKRMLRLAAENGYDYVAWTTGEQQLERYDLGDRVYRIRVSTTSSSDDRIVDMFLANSDTDGDYVNLLVDNQGVVKHGPVNYMGKNIGELVGKEMAVKIMSSTDKQTEFSGKDLRIGGEGMKGFYDDILPRFMNKYGKKWGVKVGDITLPNVEEAGRTMHSVPVTNEMKESVMQGQPMFSVVNSDKGPFGTILRGYEGRSKEAIQKLIEMKEGEAIGALSHPEVGAIDLVWGKEGTNHSDGYGLAKLVKYHPEVVENLQEILNDMHVTSRSENRINLESEKYKAAVRLTWDNQRKTWLLTVFEKKNSAPDNTTDTGETSEGSERNDTATPQDTVSDNKGSENSEDSKESGKKPLFSVLGRPVEEIVNEGTMKVENENDEARAKLNDRMRAINVSLAKLRQAAAAQREYDRETVRSITDLAKQLLAEGALSDPTRQEIQKMLTVTRWATGRKDLAGAANAIMDLMVGNQIRHAKGALDKLLKIRGSKVDARGVEVQGKLDIPGQRLMQVFKDAMDMAPDATAEHIAAAKERMDSADDAVKSAAGDEITGLTLAQEYAENVRASIDEEKGIKNELRQAAEDRRAGKMSPASYREFVQSCDEALRQNRIDRISAYDSITGRLAGLLYDSIARGKTFREEEERRIERIHHFANSDLQGQASDEHGDKNDRLTNSSLIRFFLKPLATFDQMLRYFGSKSVNGEGYLWNHFMRGWVDANDAEFKGMREATDALDRKVSDVFGRKMRWSDLYSVERTLPTVDVQFWDGGKMKDHKLTQGNLLYIYMVNKMSDGRMKLRRMGIEDEHVDAIVKQMDPRFLELADWIQDEFLPNIRNKYNRVHEKLFGAPMAAIENYFPLKVLANARVREVDMSAPDADGITPSTITGSLIKRRKNALALDILGTDAFSLVIEHLEQMEHWAAFAPFNQDLNTLLSYKTFRNRVQNMSSIYGAGSIIWENFRKSAEIAAGVYRPAASKDSIDTAAVNIAKGVTAAKISFRVYTAIKQLLSMPAFISDASIPLLAKSMATPWKSWNWALEELPGFQKRWLSRQAGDTRLMKTESDWKMWRNNFVKTAGRLGMSPNAFVDALTVSIGAKAMYDTRRKKYMQDGYTEEQADKRAKQDATVLFNETQQSNESAFLSAMQLDRTWASVALTVFRNSSMGYQRQLVDAVRNLGRKFKPGYKDQAVEFMTKQMVRDGVDEDDARAAAERNYSKSTFRDALRVAVFGFVMQFAWNLGKSLPYLLAGDDDDEKKKMIQDAARQGLLGGTVEGLTGGSVISEAANMLASGQGLKNYDPSLMPVVSDIQKVINMASYDQVAAANEVLNIMIQAGIGVNPQTLTDIGVAIYDACHGDLETSKEATLLLMRILQCPQSQIDKVFSDEMDLTAEKGLDLTIGKFAERYAEYKVRRNAATLGWMYSDENREKRVNSYEKKFTKQAQELIRTRGNDIDRAYYEYVDTEHKEVDKTLRDLRANVRDAAQSGDQVGAMEYAEMLNDFMETPEYQRYSQAHGSVNAIKRLQTALKKADSQSRDDIEDQILQLKKQMVDELKSTDNK